MRRTRYDKRQSFCARSESFVRIFEMPNRNRPQTMPQPSPMLCLRMKQTSSFPPAQASQDFHEIADQLRVMKRQEETTYKCRDYLLRRHIEELAVDVVLEERDPSDEGCARNTTNEVDNTCREKMCEWSYRVVDHFNVNREIVAVSFSYLDRFLDRCCCDRTAFKLAAMTCLYIATKVYNSREISMNSLAELSRGEFDMEHLAEMEGIILQTLSWHMHPPTAQCFIDYLYNFIPPIKASTKRIIYERACFFAELSVFDYFFVAERPSAVALSAILNAMEGVDQDQVADDTKAKFLRRVCRSGGLIHNENKLESIRDRLWENYMISEQFRKHDATPVVSAESYTGSSLPFEKDGNIVDRSPVCVSTVE